MEPSFETQTREILVDRLNGARGDVDGVARFLTCCPLPVDAPVLPVLLAACDCLDEAIARLGASATLDEPMDDRQ